MLCGKKKLQRPPSNCLNACCIGLKFLLLPVNEHYKKPPFKVMFCNFFRRILGDVEKNNLCFFVNNHVQLVFF